MFINNSQRLPIPSLAPEVWYAALQHDISPRFIPMQEDSRVYLEALRYERTPEAVIHFSENCSQLTDYGYWFLLSTLWVSYTGWSELELWKRLFKARRQGRMECLMKPKEMEFYRLLPQQVLCYRAHRPGERDWISYTLDLDIARRFAKEREVATLSAYQILRRDLLALFLRRGEYEVLCLDRKKARLVGKIGVAA